MVSSARVTASVAPAGPTWNERTEVVVGPSAPAARSASPPGLAAGPEHARVGPASVEPEQELRIRAEDGAQLRQRTRQRRAQPGGLAGGEAHRAAVIVGEQGVALT